MSEKRFGQSFAEYSIGVAVVMAALVAMSIYTKRSLQSRYADVVRGATEQFSENKSQYEPYYTNQTAVTQANSTATIDIEPEGASQRTFNESTSSTSYKKEQANLTEDEKE